MKSPRRYIAALLGIGLALAVGPARGADEPKRSDGSDLGITIMGNIIQKNVEDNVALIKEENGSVKAVKKDLVVLGKYKVVAVHAQFIELIGRDAKRYHVYQDKFAGSFAPKAASGGATLATMGDSYREEGFERVKGTITMTAMYRDKLVKEDMAKILMQATAEPFMENGAIVGFKLSQIDDDSIFVKSGVMNEDIVTSVNGHELNSIAGSIQLLQSLKGADSIEVEVRRGGMPQKITISVN
jgi:type II secretion system protein C